MFSKSVQRLPRDGCYNAKLRKIMISGHKIQEILPIPKFLFYKKSWAFCESSSYESQTQLCINKIRKLVRLLARERNMNQLKNGIIVKTYLSGK